MRPIRQGARSAVAFALVFGSLFRASAFAQTGGPAPPTHWAVIHAGLLLTDAREAPRPKMSVLVKDDKIVAIRDGYVGAEAFPAPQPQHVKTVELQNQFVMAGMVDAHSHINFPDLDFTFGLYNIGVLLRGGATTVRDAGSVPEVIFPLRKAVAQGAVLGPRILASGAPLTITGGHGDFRNGNLRAELAPAAFSSGVCDGVAECERAARRQIQFGADQIKIMASGGVLDDSDSGIDTEFSDEELKAIVDAAHLRHKPVMVHAHTADSIKAAVNAGVDCIEHGIYLNEETAALMAQHHVIFDPTLHVTSVIEEAADHPNPQVPLSENSIRKIHTLKATAPTPAQVLGLATKHGLLILTGSDGSGPITEEVIDLVKLGHLSPRDALIASTVNGASALRLSDQIGTLAPGKSADIIAFDGDPLADIANCRKLHFVMAAGRVAVNPDTGEGDATPPSVVLK